MPSKKFLFLCLLFLAVGGVSTAAHALKVEFYVNDVLVHQTGDVATPSATDSICSAAPCTGSKGKIVRQCINGSSSDPACSASTDPDFVDYGGVLRILKGARVEAKIETNGTTIGGTTGPSNSIINTLNAVGAFRMLVPGKLEIVTSSDFALRPPVAGSTTDLGTWRTLNRGGSKCALISGVYSPSFCSITGGSLDTGSCTICRSYGFTDDGYIFRKDLAGAYTLPASGVRATMTSSVTFKDTTGAAATPISVGTPLTTTIPVSSNVEDGHFYLGTPVQMNAPCEPFRTTCATSEKKTSKLLFEFMVLDDQVNLPATSTDVSAGDPGVLTASLRTHIPIDVQPIDPVADPNNPGFYVGGINNDWDPKSQGNRQVLALSTPEVDACSIQAFDGPTPLVFLSVAGSEFIPLSGFSQYAPNGSCIGQIFAFDMGAINETIDPDFGTADQKRETCLNNPVATLLVMNAELTSTYLVEPGKGGGKKATYQPGPECTTEGNTTTCTVTGQVGGSQVVTCSPSAGG